MDCDLRKPVLHKYLKAGHNVKGVSNIVSNQCKLEEALLRLEQFKITFLPAGTPPPNPSELLGSARMQQMIQQLRATFDYVIFDAPPISMVTDAAVIGNQVDGALFVVRSSYAPAESVEAAVKKLKDTGVKVLGAVLTRYDAKTALKGSNYAYNYYSYGYSYGTSQTDPAASQSPEKRKHAKPAERVTNHD